MDVFLDLVIPFFVFNLDQFLVQTIRMFLFNFVDLGEPIPDPRFKFLRVPLIQVKFKFLVRHIIDILII